jgi:hypothetical protein
MGSTPFGGKNVKGNIAEAGANSKFTYVERQNHTPVLFRGQLPKFGAVLRAWFSGALPRSDNGGNGPALLYLFAAAMRAGTTTCLIVDER